MDIRTILWPTDLSKNSLKAAPQVMSLATRYQARVIMLYVGTDLMAHDMSYGFPGEEHLKNFQKWELEQAKKKMEGVCDKDLKACPQLQVRLVTGDAAAEILKMVTAEKADMIVMTTHGKGAENVDRKDPAFGSVALKVIKGASVPVTLVNPLAG